MELWQDSRLFCSLSSPFVILQMGEKIKKGQLCYLVSLCDAGAAGEGKQHQVVSSVDSPPYFCTTNNMQSAVVYLSQVRLNVALCVCFLWLLFLWVIMKMVIICTTANLLSLLLLLPSFYLFSFIVIYDHHHLSPPPLLSSLLLLLPYIYCKQL